MSYVVRKTFNLGTTGLAAQITCTVTPSTDVTVGTVTELGTSGCYYADITVPGEGQYGLLWNSHEAEPAYGSDEINITAVDSMAAGFVELGGAETWGDNVTNRLEAQAVLLALIDQTNPLDPRLADAALGPLTQLYLKCAAALGAGNVTVNQDGSYTVTLPNTESEAFTSTIQESGARVVTFPS